MSEQKEREGTEGEKGEKMERGEQKVSACMLYNSKTETLFSLLNKLPPVISFIHLLLH